MSELVTVRSMAIGVVLVGDDPVAPAGSVTVVLAGSTVSIDPARPDACPSCVVTDASVGVEVMAALLGDDVADAVRDACSLAESGTAHESQHAPLRTAELDALTRLAIVRWCQETSPLPLDVNLLRLEELTLMGELSHLLDDDHEWLFPLSSFGDALVKHATEAASPDVPGLSDLTRRALILLAERLPVADALTQRVGDALAHIRPPATDFPCDDELLNDLADRLRPVGAVIAGADDSLFVGASTVDWLDVPTGGTSLDEGNVAWTLEMVDDGATVTVAVEGIPETRPYPGIDVVRIVRSERLWFDLHSPGWPFPLATGELLLDSANNSWVGGSSLVGPQFGLLAKALDGGAQVSVRVRDALGSPPRNPVIAEAYRWSCRALGLTRIAVLEPAEALFASSSSAWTRASILWSAAKSEIEAEMCRGLASATRLTTSRRASSTTVAKASLARFHGTVAERWLLVSGQV